MSKQHPLALAIATLLATQASHAASTTQPPSHAGDKIVITGSSDSYRTGSSTGAMRMEMGQLETPQQVNVISEQLIIEQGATTLGQVLSNDASISAGGTSRNRERFSLRGFDLNSGSGFLRNGQQHWSHYRQPIELLDRVEVLKGPSGLLYGKSAPGGLVNMVSKKPTYEHQTTLRQDFGSDNEFRTTLDTSGALTADQRLRARLVLSHQQYDSWREYTDGSTPETERFVGGLFVDYDLTDNATLSFHYDKTRDDGSVDSGAYIQNGKPVLGDKHIWNAQWSNIDNDVENIGVDLDWQLSDNWKLNAGYNHQDLVRHDLESSSFSDYNPTTGTYKVSGFDRHDNWQFDTAYADLSGRFHTGQVQHEVLVGTNWLNYYYKRQQQSFRGGSAVDATVGQPIEKPADLDYRSANATVYPERASYGLYVQDLITLNPQWQLLVGARYDYEDDGEETQGNVVPKAGVIYHPTTAGSIYLTYAESFEPQGPVSDPDDINDGMKLDPVSGEIYELGTKWNLMDDRLLLSAAVFDLTQSNKVLKRDRDDLGAGLTETRQIGEQKHIGAELMAAGQLTDKLSLQGSAIWLDAELKDPYDASLDGNRPADVPEFAASIWTRYDLTGNTAFNLGATHVGERYGDSRNTYKKDGYTRFDAGVSHKIRQFKQADLTLRLKVENLFDEDYLAGGDDDTTVIGEGRNFLASVEMRF
ncbi:iron complex outermembrane receptor protein [Marinobacterium halophilum]|uniref:Iron complex outermembrane receptor protein n=1 Tax=Marinobacterium halophilum TaxID=267374 RepID=A0A2P8EYX0_9GAMM|nr:TonB-dependent siderophore receptor [Marinobacterium halophilum]PSL14658.1 iron complex outermembrane receptor protein [Marinobacterium halophilum]